MNLKDLAKELNLSISSVSRALRDSDEISAATKKKVLAKAKELNYHANPFASNLRRQKSKTIAVVIPEIANNFFSLAINGAESYAQKKGLRIDTERHLVLKAAHPSPLAANRGGFFGCRVFSKTNQYLQQYAKAPIQWQLDDF